MSADTPTPQSIYFEEGGDGGGIFAGYGAGYYWRDATGREHGPFDTEDQARAAMEQSS